MTLNQDTTDFWERTELLPSISIDCVIFGFNDNQLKILLLKYKGTNYFALPGGFIDQNEDLEDSAIKILKERTGLKDIYLEQFYTFGKKNRRDDAKHIEVLSKQGLTLAKNHFILNRFISVGYFALIDFTKANPTPDKLTDLCNWYDVSQIPDLIFDHSDIVKKALEKLRFLFDERLIDFNRRAFPLLPETFTMVELQSLYETILGRKLLRANFQRKILSLNILERLDKKMTGAANKAPYLYRFLEEKEGNTLK
jgi:8-oxo-dGTP diphosphatase